VAELFGRLMNFKYGFIELFDGWKMQFLGDGRPHGVAPTDSLKVNKHPKSYSQTKKYICRGGPVWPPASIAVSFYLSDFKHTEKPQFESFYASRSGYRSLYFNLKLSAIIAINSLFVGFPRLF
jgi:hypothetical protein